MSRSNFKNVVLALISLAVIALALVLAKSANAATIKPSWPANNRCAYASDIMMRCNVAKALSFKVTVKPMAYVARGKWRPTKGRAFPVTIKVNCDGGSKSVVKHPTGRFTFKSKYLKGFNGLLLKSRRCHIEASAHPSLADSGGVDWVSTSLSARYRA